MNKLRKILIFGKKSIITKEFINFEKKSKLIKIKIINSSKIIKDNKINEEYILKCIESFKPKVIINNISIKNLAYCEKNKKKSYFVNFMFSNVLNRISKQKKIYYIFISTASLFENYKKKQKAFTVNCKPSFNNYYSQTKLIAERSLMSNQKAIIFRLSNLYSSYTKNFIYRLCVCIKNDQQINAKYNCFFSPVNTSDLVNFIILKIFPNFSYYCKKKIIHFSENNFQSRFNFFLKVEKFFNKRNLVLKDYDIKNFQINTCLKSNIRYNFLGLKNFLKKI